jgi:hypothetical protein
MAGKFLAGGGKVPLPQDGWIGWLVPGAVVGILFFIFLACFHAARSLSRLPEPVRRRPQFTLHGIFWISLALGFLLLPREGIIPAVLMGVAMMLPFFLWRLGYLFLSGKRGIDPEELGTIGGILDIIERETTRLSQRMHGG